VEITMSTSTFFGTRVWVGALSLAAMSALSACAAPAGEATAESSAALSTRCESDAECPAGDYCSLPSGADEMCGSTRGTCAARPTFCPEYVIEGGLCGCDGNDYGNDCFAARAGVSIAYAGACGATAGDLCGGPTDIACGAGLYCDLAAGDACGSVGTCTARPTRCPYICSDACHTCSGAAVCNPCLAARGGETVSSSSCP
jgi:hypothetical protein